MKIQYSLTTLFLIVTVFAIGVAFGYTLPVLRELIYFMWVQPC